MMMTQKKGAAVELTSMNQMKEVSVMKCSHRLKEVHVVNVENGVNGVMVNQKKVLLVLKKQMRMRMKMNLEVVLPLRLVSNCNVMVVERQEEEDQKEVRFEWRAWVRRILLPGSCPPLLLHSPQRTLHLRRSSLQCSLRRSSPLLPARSLPADLVRRSPQRMLLLRRIRRAPRHRPDH